MRVVNCSLKHPLPSEVATNPDAVKFDLMRNLMRNL